jgi:hypothetical protein
MHTHDWRTLFTSTLAETNVTTLERIVPETEEAIRLRLQELARTTQDPVELSELRSAADQLLSLKAQRLGWPRPLSTNGAPSSADRPSNTQDYDIFSGLPETDPLWLETVAGLDLARKHMKALATKSPGPYFIFDCRSSKIVVSLDTSGSEPSVPENSDVDGHRRS